MEKIVVSAPGKVILSGEHAAVYGYPAIVAAIDRRLKVTLKPGNNTRKQSRLVSFILKKVIKPNEAVNLEIESDLPSGSGLGSSAALATALVWALKPKAPLKEKNRLVKAIEDHQHFKSSGVDQAIVREGGWLRFQKGLFRPFPARLKQAILIDSGKPGESTGEMVAMVAAGGKKAVLRQIGSIAKDWKPDLIGVNERLLEKLGVVGKRAQTIIRQVEAAGGMAKICGAGGVKAGSGMLLAYHPDQEKLLKLIQKNRWRHLIVSLGAPGVRYEKS